MAKGTFLSASKRAANCSALSLLALSSAASAVSASLAIFAGKFRKKIRGAIGLGEFVLSLYGKERNTKMHESSPATAHTRNSAKIRAEESVPMRRSPQRAPPTPL